MRHPFKIVVFSLLLILLHACKKQKGGSHLYDEDINPIVANSVDRDLEDIKKDGVLKALVVYSSTSYFLYKGQPIFS